MGLPLAYFLTWTTYGAWLPGHRRGWVDKHTAAPQAPYREPDPLKEALARKRMKEPPVLLSAEARLAVNQAIAGTCAWRDWLVRGLGVRSSHVHVVVSAGDISPGMVMKALKSYGARALNELLGRRKR